MPTKRAKRGANTQRAPPEVPPLEFPDQAIPEALHPGTHSNESPNARPQAPERGKKETRPAPCCLLVPSTRSPGRPSPRAFTPRPSTTSPRTDTRQEYRGLLHSRPPTPRPPGSHTRRDALSQVARTGLPYDLPSSKPEAAFESQRAASESLAPSTAETEMAIHASPLGPSHGSLLGDLPEGRPPVLASQQETRRGCPGSLEMCMQVSTPHEQEPGGDAQEPPSCTSPRDGHSC